MTTTVTEPSTAVKPSAPGVRYVIDNLKYPDYIRTHNVFHKQNEIKKVFPSLGLPNSTEECEYNCIDDARSDATNLIYTDIRLAVARALDIYGLTPDLRQLVNSIYNILVGYYMQLINVEDGRIVLRFHMDCGTLDGKPFIRKGEGLFKAYNKLSEKIKEVTGKDLGALDSMPYFKSFSAVNIPAGRKFKIVFSSVGEEGLWDIATISMRGISSCQTWNTPQSRGLIGSMSSRYVGVIYITSGEKFNEYGSKMMRRSLVRFCINTKTKKPGLLVDRTYPASNPQIMEMFRNFLTKRTGLPVIFAGEPDWTNYQLPQDTAVWKLAPFQPNEYTYMDTKIPMLPAKPQPVKDFGLYFAAIQELDTKVITSLHNRIVKMTDEYCVDKTRHADLFKGGVGNLMLTLKKNYYGGCYTVIPIIPSLYNFVVATTIFPAPESCETVSQYEKLIIRSAFLQMGELVKNSQQKLRSLGTKYTRHYPKSMEKYHNFIMNEYKKELIEVYKKLVLSNQ